MIFREVKRPLELLLFSSSIHILVGMGVEEQRVWSPGEGFGAGVQIIVARRERDVAIVLGHEVFLVLGMFTFNLLHPEVASHNCGETAVVTDLTPEVGGVFGVVYDSFAFRGPLFGGSVYDDGAG